VFLYLDLNCFNRPFDDQQQERIARETAAIFLILQRVVEGVDQLAWSAVLDFENSQHPLLDRRTEIARWAQRAVVNVALGEPIMRRARELGDAGIAALDAAHIAAAEAGGCDRLLTCDEPLIRRARRIALALRVQDPVEYLEEQTHA
jgi:predicted nucleic acid-binding protein